MEWRRTRAQRRRTPVLSLLLDPADLVIERVFYTDCQEGNAAWARLGVRNEPDHDAAREVEVLLERARPLDGGAPVLIAYPAVPWTHVPRPTTRVTIPPGATRALDLATVYFRDDWEKRLNLQIVAEPGDTRQRVAPGRYELILVVTAHNADAQRYAVQVSWDGEFGGEPKCQIWEHFTVAAPVPLPATKKSAD